MPSVSELFIYPVKSLGGIALTSATLTDRGLQNDRRWMLVDGQNKFMTQREFSGMALVGVEITTEGLKVFHKLNPENFFIFPFIPQTNETSAVTIWSDICKAQFVSAGADEWFSSLLSFKCRLVYMPDSTRRPVDTRYASDNELTNLSDGYPLMVLGQASLDDLNSRLTQPLPINRFRPNIVVTGTKPFEEDLMEHFMINGIDFYGIKLCERCTITTINQETGEQSKDPLKTLATYRMRNNRIYFGQNLVYKQNGIIKTGDQVTIMKTKNAIL